MTIVARREDFLLIEDNPYSLFRPANARPPTLKSLDKHCQVMFLGSFAKTAFAGARVGYIIADQMVASAEGEHKLRADQLAKLKNMVTLNTSTVAQAVISGYLIENKCSLRHAIEREADVYSRNLAAMLNRLQATFAGAPRTRPTMSWNTPAGGMFIVVSFPFVADDAMLEYSACRFGALVDDQLDRGSRVSG